MTLLPSTIISISAQQRLPLCLHPVAVRARRPGIKIIRCGEFLRVRVPIPIPRLHAFGPRGQQWGQSHLRSCHHAAMAMSTSRSGDAAQREAAIPISPYASAQKGNASGSVAARAAVPSPCAAEAVASPRVIGSAVGCIGSGDTVE